MTVIQDAVTCFSKGAYKRALDLCNGILHQEPQDFDALHLTALIHLKQGELDRALDFMNRALSISPSQIDALQNKSILLNVLGHFEENVIFLEKLPLKMRANITLTELYMEALRKTAAQLVKEKKFKKAHVFHAKIFELEPGSLSAFVPYICDFSRHIQSNEVIQKLSTFIKSHPIQRLKSSNNPHAIRLGLMIYAKEGTLEWKPPSFVVKGSHTEVLHLLDRTIFCVDLLFMPTRPTSSFVEKISNNYDLLFNLVADSGLDEASLQAALEVEKRLEVPIINLASCISNTDREYLACKVSALKHVRIPVCKVLPSLQPLAQIEQYIKKGELSFPILLRPLDSHTGKGLEKLDNRDDVINYLGNRADQKLYLNQFIDFRSKDGFYRKYRCYWVNGQIVRNHLFIHTHWEVHGKCRTETMASRPWMKQEEESFLTQAKLHLTTRNFDDVACFMKDLQQVVGLDYFGVDFSINRDDEIIFFEANASMLSSYPFWHDDYPYVKQATQELKNALATMLQNKLA